MKVVIDIPKDVYMEIMVHNREMRTGSKSSYYFKGLIQNGTPLPKGHGRLIDADDLMRELSVVSSRPIKSQLYIVRDAPTIIEADKEGGDKSDEGRSNQKS